MFNAQQFAARLANRQDRWSLLKDFVAEWHRPLQARDGYSARYMEGIERELGFSLPLALRELYEIAGKRKGIAVGPTWNLLFPRELEAEGDYLEFYREGQDVVAWYLKLPEMDQPDPPVYLAPFEADADQQMLLENYTLSEFILQMTVMNTVVASVFAGRLGRKIKSRQTLVERHFSFLGFPEWRWPLEASPQFYGGPGTLIITFGKGDSREVWVRGANRAILNNAVRQLNAENSDIGYITRETDNASEGLL